MTPQTRRPKAQPILVIAPPRSGSSWFAEQIGSSTSVVYRREPLTQHLLHRGEDAFAYCDPAEAADAENAVIRSAFSPEGDRRALVKEVVPLRLPLIVAVADPKIVILLRHPLAVAASQHAQGWVFGSSPPRRFSRRDADLFERLETMWSGAGDIVRTVAYTAATVVAMRRTAPEALRVRYEPYQQDPGRFALLAETIGVAPPSPARSSEPNDDAAYGTSRSASYDPHTWRKLIEPGAVPASRSVWRSFGLDEYPDAEWE